MSQRTKIQIVPPPRMDDWEMSLSRKANGTVESTQGNAILVLSNHPEWRGIRFNKFTQTTTVHDPPTVKGFDAPKPDLDEYCAAFIAQWMAKNMRIKLRPSELFTAADVAGKQGDRAYHPVREYLDGLEWDGEPRISSWLPDLLNVDASKYSSAVGRMWLISAVARVMSPGCQADHMLLFEGTQGYGKSSALRALVGNEWFFDSRLDLRSKESFEVLRGKWIIEAAELDSFRGSEATRVKSFITSRIDTFRKSYGRKSEDVARQCVIAGSTNEKFYLNDPTGNRRFWPVKVRDYIDVGKVEGVRDQLWAEAYSEFLDGKAWHITDKSLLIVAENEQARREIEHPWEGVVSNWLKMNNSRVNASSDGVSVQDVCYDALKIETKDMGRPGTIGQVSHILTKVGLVVRPGEENVRPRKYFLAREVEDEE